MLSILDWASVADGWLRERLGRPYETALSIGLGLSIAATFKAIGDAASAHAAGAPVDITKMAATVVFEAALLVNQLAQLNERRAARRLRREERAAKREAAKS